MDGATPGGPERARVLLNKVYIKTRLSESLEADYRFVPPSQVFDFSLGAVGDQVEVDKASHPPQPSSDSSATDSPTASGRLPQHASDSREQNQAVEKPAREEQKRLAREEQDRLARVEKERLVKEEQERFVQEEREKLVIDEKERRVREEQERVTHEEQEKPVREEQETPATEEKERLVKNIAKQWEERLGQKIPKEKTDAEPQELIQGPSHQTAAENELRTVADQEVGNPIHSRIPECVTNSEEPIQAVELRTTRPSRDRRADPAMVWIKFKIRGRGSWRVVQDLEVDPSNPSKVKRIAMKYMRKLGRMHIFDTNLRMLTPQTCFEDVTADGTNTILLIPERDIDTDNLPSSVPEKRSDLQTNSEVDLSPLEPNPEDGKEDSEEDGEETVRRRFVRRDSR
ncbi:hypothetical protein G7Y89_g11248 [Cudoniella acicularis]|uniref:Uncharacterized protein n=1 Tax=Cudoniella acicularis TaxID=354080 RepID=A0A8H4RCQ2_9HELO|nr:hypothetical protein G7Y89_g11248 [Cudoniella acicularis]